MNLSFAYPLVLFLLLAPALLLVWVWRREGRRVVLPFDHGGRGSGRAWRMLLSVAESAPALVLAVVLVLLAGPQCLSEPKTKRALTNIQLCVDVSGSMTAEFGDGTRYDVCMQSINEFLDYRKGDAFGLSFFSDAVLHWVPLTSDGSAMRCAPPFMRPEVAYQALGGGTQIGMALRACSKVLAERQEGDRMILLLTDGDSADLWGGADLAVAKELRDAGITVFAVLVGGQRIQDEIVNITSMTGGESFEAGDPEGLKSIFRRIDQMKQAKLQKTMPDTMDNFEPFAVVGLILLALAILALFGLRYTPW
jgi:Ca-activated chloride channel family protein